MTAITRRSATRGADASPTPGEIRSDAGGLRYRGGVRISLLVLVACAGCDAADSLEAPIEIVDAQAGTDTSCGCNPMAQTGCGVGEKCTSIRLDAANGRSTMGCVPEGSVAIGDACIVGPLGGSVWGDDCQAGGVCVAGKCEAICVSSPDSCEAPATCVRYVDLLRDNYGACE